MFTKTAYEAFMKLKQVRHRSWGGDHIYIYMCYPPKEPRFGGNKLVLQHSKVKWCNISVFLRGEFYTYTHL